MRIIGGNFKGRRIEVSKNLAARPTTDFAKEGLFNVLRSQLDLDKITVLDLFSGSGGIGLEFSSRGAINCTCVDQDGLAIKSLRNNIKKLEIKNLRTVRSDVLRFIRQNKQSYSLVFADPPYASDLMEKLPSLILASKSLKEEGLLILEHGKDHDFSEEPHFLKSKKYGNVNFTFFSKQ